MARRDFVRDEFGPLSWNKVLAALPEEDRETLRGSVLASAWYPFELNERLDAAIVEQMGEGDSEIFQRIGARSAERNLGGPHRAFLSPGDPLRFMASAPRIYKFYYDTGDREFVASGPKSGVLSTFGAETFSETDCLTVIGWYKKALQMCGADRVVMKEVSCRARGGECCRYEVSWD